jgi:two-component system chemotaxis response regulator CheB
MSYDAIVIGTSAGGIRALHKILAHFPDEMKQVVFIVQHIKSDSNGSFIESFNKDCALPVLEAQDKDFALAGHIYVAPPGYHLLINDDKSISLSLDDFVHYSRPSIDVLFESASEVYEDKLIGIILTGANQDGAAGLRAVKVNGGLTLVQHPDEAESAMMPRAAIEATEVDYVMELDEIGRFLSKLN